MDFPTPHAHEAFDAWIRRWKVERLDIFEMPDRKVDPHEPTLGVVATFGRGGRRGGLLELVRIQDELSEALGCVVAVLTPETLQEMKDSHRRQAILESLSPIDLKVADAA